MNKFRFGTLLLTAVALIAFLPTAADAQDIEAGIDVWQTRGQNSTFVSFGDDPIPADFFCSGSEPFSGAIAFRGVPLVTEPAGAFGNADTILERLDHASFNEKGVATTRLQMRALQFEGAEIFRTACGDFKVTVGLQGEQPITEMKIYHPNALALRRGGNSAPGAGRFAAEIAVNVAVQFTPLAGGPAVEVLKNVVFPQRANSFWSSHPGPRGLTQRGFVRVDTNSDGLADTFLPGTSRNFAAGWVGQQTQAEFLQASRLDVIGSAGPVGVDAIYQEDILRDDFGCDDCHCDPSCTHCLNPIVFDDGEAATQ